MPLWKACDGSGSTGTKARTSAGRTLRTLQSDRLGLYQAAAEKLIGEGRAYRCFCTPERLDQLRAAQAAAKQPPGYDGLCRTMAPEEATRRAAGEPSVVRFAMGRHGQTVLDDVVRGQIVFENALQDDFVILKSDGYPTYHLAVVVDDAEMEVSHVIRGDEWISSAPKHIQLYEALGSNPPVWAHLPLILGPDHKKLSKRSGDTAVLDYRDKGYLPEAMVKFPRVPRLVPRRPHFDHQCGNADAPFRPRARGCQPGCLRHRAAGLPERPLHPRDGAGALGSRHRQLV